MGNACRSFGFNEDDGMRVFSIVEMFLACYHVICASYVYRNIAEELYLKHKDKDQVLSKGHIFVMAWAMLILITLSAQAVCGFLLYLKGWKERNRFVCHVWQGLAIANLILSNLIAVTELASGGIHFWSRFFLYLLYVLYGVWVVQGFVKWFRNYDYNYEPKPLCPCRCRREPHHDDMVEIPIAASGSAHSQEIRRHKHTRLSLALSTESSRSVPKQPPPAVVIKPPPPPTPTPPPPAAPQQQPKRGSGGAASEKSKQTNRTNTGKPRR